MKTQIGKKWHLYQRKRPIKKKRHFKKCYPAGGTLSFAVDRDGEDIFEMSAFKEEFKRVSEYLEIIFIIDSY